MTQADQGSIKNIVRDHYGSFAEKSRIDATKEQSEAACCATPKPFYNLEDVQNLPAESINASAGCGNPTAIGELQQGETVVDFGSGGGIDCFIAAQAVGRSGKVVGIDMTTEMIALANENKAKLNLDNVAFHLSEMEHTPLENNSTDVIISNCVINLAPDKNEVFKEAIRILKPGGRAYISDMLLVGELPEEAHSDGNWVACLSGAEHKDDYIGKMQKAGFVDIEIVSDTPWNGEESWAQRVHSMNIRAYKAKA